MRVYFDNVAFSVQKAGGVSAVWNGLIRNFPSHYVIKYLEWENNNIYRSNTKLPNEKLEKRSIKYFNIKRFFNVKINDSKKFIFHSSTYRVASNKNALNVITVHDFIDQKAKSSFFRRKLKMLRMRKSINRATAVICVSNNTKQDLIKYFPKINIEKIYTIYNGKSEHFKVLNKEISSSDYVLFIGNRIGYKNFDILVNALKLNKSKKLIIVGGGELNKKEKKELSLLGNNYKHYIGIEDDKLNQLYNNAFCLVYPSAYEGFGMPGIEAQSAGCPVIAYNKSSIPEVLGNSAILLDEATPESINNELIKLDNIETRAKYIKLGLENSKRFSWEIMANGYMEVYKKIWSESLE